VISDHFDAVAGVVGGIDIDRAMTRTSTDGMGNPYQDPGAFYPVWNDLRQEVAMCLSGSAENIGLVCDALRFVIEAYIEQDAENSDAIEREIERLNGDA
jgi:hypothetical protein